MAQKAIGIRLDGLVAPDKDDARCLPLRVGVAIPVGLRCVDDDHIAVFRRRTDHAGQIACEAGESECRDVRRFHACGCEIRNLPADVAAGSMDNDDGLAAELFFHLEGLLGDFVVSLIPADALPFAFSALSCATHGVLQAVGVIDGVGHGKASHAKLTVRHCIQWVAFNLLKLVVLCVKKHAAAHMAARRRPVRGARDGIFPLVPLPFAVMVCGSVKVAEPFLVIGHVLSSRNMPPSRMPREDCPWAILGRGALFRIRRIFLSCARDFPVCWYGRLILLFAL